MAVTPAPRSQPAAHAALCVARAPKRCVPRAKASSGSFSSMTSMGASLPDEDDDEPDGFGGFRRRSSLGDIDTDMFSGGGTVAGGEPVRGSLSGGRVRARCRMRTASCSPPDPAWCSRGPPARSRVGGRVKAVRACCGPRERPRKPKAHSTTAVRRVNCELCVKWRILCRLRNACPPHLRTNNCRLLKTNRIVAPAPLVFCRPTWVSQGRVLECFAEAPHPLLARSCFLTSLLPCLRSQ